jgi:platelet-activating factor acetylhydrolase IB subunit alpha
LASASNDQTGRIWDLTSGECKMELRGHEHVVECIAFAPTTAYPFIYEMLGIEVKKTGQEVPGQYVVTGCRDKLIKLWDTQSGQCVHTFVGHDNWVRDLVFHPSGKYLLSASDDKTMKVWELRSGRCCKTIEAHQHFTTCIAFNRTSPVVATGSVDQVVKVWDCR